MNLALSIVLLFVGACLLWVAVHGTEATTPWQVFQQIIAGLNGTGGAAGADRTESGSTLDNGDTGGVRTQAPGYPV